MRHNYVIFSTYFNHIRKKSTLDPTLDSLTLVYLLYLMKSLPLYMYTFTSQNTHTLVKSFRSPRDNHIKNLGLKLTSVHRFWKIRNHTYKVSLVSKVKCIKRRHFIYDKLFWPSNYSTWKTHFEVFELVNWPWHGKLETSHNRAKFLSKHLKT